MKRVEKIDLIILIMGEEEKSLKEKRKEEIKKLVLRKLEEAKKGDYFLLLDLPNDATKEQVQEAFFVLAKKIHPDVIAQLELNEIKNETALAFRAVTEAYKVLTDKNLRAKYILRESTKNEEKPEINKRKKEEEAMMFFHKGEIFLKRRRFKEAEEAFSRAIQFDSSKGCYYASLGWSIFQNTDYSEEKRLEEARRNFERALEISHNDAEPYYYMALYYKEIGNYAKEKQFLQTAITIRPKYTEALRELRLLSLRKQKKQQGFFSKLTKFFKKKKS